MSTQSKIKYLHGNPSAKSDFFVLPHYVISDEISKLYYYRDDMYDTCIENTPMVWPFERFVVEYTHETEDEDGQDGPPYTVFVILGRASNPKEVLATAITLHDNRNVMCIGNDMNSVLINGDYALPLHSELLNHMLVELPRKALAYIRLAMSVRGISQERVAPPAKLNKARVRRGKPPLREYTVLKIGSVTQRDGTERPVTDADRAARAMHLRAGHRRNQACGPRWSEHREIYVPPCIVNFTEGAELRTPRRIVKL